MFSLTLCIFLPSLEVITGLTLRSEPFHIAIASNGPFVIFVQCFSFQNYQHSNLISIFSAMFAISMSNVDGMFSEFRDKFQKFEKLRR